MSERDLTASLGPLMALAASLLGCGGAGAPQPEPVVERFAPLPSMRRPGALDHCFERIIDEMAFHHGVQLTEREREWLVARALELYWGVDGCDLRWDWGQ